jgi:hypothetical protein
MGNSIRMKGFLRLAISGLPLVAADCPSSPSAVHASCKALRGDFDNKIDAS